MKASGHVDDQASKLWLGLSTAMICWALYFAVLAVYRITIHPLAKFPGPKFAAATYLFEFWYDVVCWGRYTRKIGRMHERYGPIIRINPDELHCNDPEFIDHTYPSVQGIRDKPKHFLRFFPTCAHMTAVATEKHETHRQRRKSLNKFFSKAQVLQLEGLIHDNAQKLCDKLLASQDKEVFNISQAYSCFATDIIMAMCFGETGGFLDQPGWVPNYKASIDILFSLGHIWRFFPVLAYLSELLPLLRFIIKWISTDVGRIMEDIKIVFPDKIKQTSTMSNTIGLTDQPTLFAAFLEDSLLPPEEKSIQRLAIEANAMLVGGTESPTNTLTVFTYHILENPAILQRLHAEVASVVSDERNVPEWQTLEQLPYLSAVLQESLRLAYGVSGRLARVATEEDIPYTGSWTPKHAVEAIPVNHVIPRGYALGMSSYLVHNNESLFQEPTKFLPQRWLHDSGERDRRLEKYLLSFSKGSRNCVGIQMAYAELYVSAAALVMRVLPHMRLYETKRSDLDYDHDELSGKPVSRSKGVRVTMDRA